MNNWTMVSPILSYRLHNLREFGLVSAIPARNACGLLQGKWVDLWYNPSNGGGSSSNRRQKMGL